MALGVATLVDPGIASAATAWSGTGFSSNSSIGITLGLTLIAGIFSWLKRIAEDASPKACEILSQYWALIELHNTEGYHIYQNLKRAAAELNAEDLRQLASTVERSLASLSDDQIHYPVMLQQSLIPLLPLAERSRFGLELLNALARHHPMVLNGALFSEFAETFGSLDPDGRKALLDRVIEGLGSASFDQQYYFIQVADSMIDRMNRPERAALWKAFGDILQSGSRNSGSYGLMLEWLPHSTPEECREFFLELAGRYGDGNAHQSESLFGLMELLGHRLRAPAKRRLVKQILRRFGLVELNPEILETLVGGFGSRDPLFHAGTQDACQRRLLRYLESALPLDATLWRTYIAAPDPEAYLREWETKISEYRNGKSFDSGDVEAAIASYAALELVGLLPWREFRGRMSDVPIPETFLGEAFEATLDDYQSIHSRINKWRLMRAVEPLAEGDHSGKMALRLLQFFAAQSTLGDFGKTEYDRFFPDGSMGISSEALESGIERLLRHLAAHQDREVNRNFALPLAWYLAWQRAPEPVKAAMRVLGGEKVPSSRLWQALQASEEFYRESLAATLAEYGLEHHSDFREHHAALREELEKARQGEQRSFLAKFLPSKNLADQFFSYVGSDCNAERAFAIARPDFQLYRIVPDKHLRGLLYIQKAELDGKRVLVMAVQPRLYWQVDPDSLLTAIEANFSRIAESGGYDYLLLVDDPNQQSNRVDIQHAIAERDYPAIEFEDPIGEAIFSGNKFRVVWQRSKVQHP